MKNNQIDLKENMKKMSVLEIFVDDIIYNECKTVFSKNEDIKYIETEVKNDDFQEKFKTISMEINGINIILLSSDIFDNFHFMLGIAISGKDEFDKLIDKFKDMEIADGSLISFDKMECPFFYTLDEKSYENKNLIEIGMELSDKGKLFYEENLKNTFNNDLTEKLIISENSINQNRIKYIIIKTDRGKLKIEFKNNGVRDYYI
jgi:hypothetical protein